MKSTTVLISGRAKSACEAVQQLLEGQADLDIHVALLDEVHPDPLHGQAETPDVLIALIDDHGEESLKALYARPASKRPPTIVIGPASDAPMMRKAMQAGARDYFGPSLKQSELLEALRRIAKDRGVELPTGPRGAMIAVINAKGGSGASTIAANLAHILAVSRKADVALIDLDLQFGALPLAFDLKPHQSLLDMVAAADRIDPVGLKDHAARHGSGVAVFSAMSDQMPLPWQVSAQSLSQLLDTARRAYSTVVVDLPRQIDPLTTRVLEQADKILIVMQQSLSHIRDAKRLLRVLTSNLAVPRDSVTVVVNRHVERSTLSVQDIEDAISPPRLVLLPNDYKTVSEAQNIGTPLQELDVHAPITVALTELIEALTQNGGDGGSTPSKPRRGLRAAIANALRS